MAAQALQTNAIKVKIDKQEGETMCRMCKIRKETVRHIISKCSKLAQMEYNKRTTKSPELSTGVSVKHIT